MTDALFSLAGFVAAFLLIIVLFLVLKNILNSRSLWRDTDAFLTSLDGAGTVTCEEASLDALPEVVKQYLDRVIDFNKPLPGAALVRHGGRFRLDEKQEWTTINGEELLGGSEIGYIWRAKLKISPLVWLTVRDMYRNRMGDFTGMLYGALRVVHAFGPETDASSLARYLSELVLFPHMLMPGNGVQWEPLGEFQARASMEDGDVQVSGVFTFGADGLPLSFESEDRYQMEGDYTFAQRPWKVQYSQYRSYDGVALPSQIEASWKECEGNPVFSYGVFSITGVTFR